MFLAVILPLCIPDKFFDLNSSLSTYCAFPSTIETIPPNTGLCILGSNCSFGIEYVVLFISITLIFPELAVLYLSLFLRYSSLDI